MRPARPDDLIKTPADGTLHPSDADAWLGLATCYDRLRRFDLADRAYKQVLVLIGPTVTILNNQGYSYMLRGDYRRTREAPRRPAQGSGQQVHRQRPAPAQPECAGGERN